MVEDPIKLFSTRAERSRKLPMPTLPREQLERRLPPSL